MLAAKKNIKILKIAVYLFIATTAIFLWANLARAAGLDLGLDKIGNINLGQANPIVIAARIIRIVLGFLGIISVILVIYAGWLWMTSAGDERKIERAKAMLKNAVIGIIIILLSFAIVSFILGSLLNGLPRGDGANVARPGTVGLAALGGGIIQSHY